MTLCERIEKTAFEHGERPAYISEAETLTYSELWRCSSELAKTLSQQGTKPVLICGNKSAPVLISLLACLISKRAYVPVSEETPESRIENIISQTEAPLMIRGGKLIPLGKSPISEEKTENETAYIIFTSGSTGEPKGVPVSYANLEHFTEWISTTEGLGSYSGMRVYNQASFSFDLSVASICYALGNGNTLLCSDEKPEKALPFLKKCEATMAVLTPTMLRMLLLDGGFSEKELPLLKCVYLCGELLETSTAAKFMERFSGAQIINAYGPTEATSAVSAVTITKAMLKNELLPVGRIETAAAEICLCGEEIVLKGESVAKGYLHEQGDAFFKEGNVYCYRTGDLGEVKDGFLYCKGRLDRQIKYKGYRVEPEEIENVLTGIKGISGAAVIAKKKGSTVLYLKAFLTAEKPFTAEEIKEEARRLLPEYMVPKAVVFLDSIPVTGNGKCDRKRLEEL